MICSYSEMKIGRTSANDVDVVHWDYPLEVRASTCMFCGSPLNRELVGEKRTIMNNWFGIYLHLCKCCGWWKIDWTYLDTFNDGSNTNRLYGIAKYYNEDSLDVPIEQLRKYLARNTTSLAHIHPTKFELLMQDCLSSEYAPCEVVHCGQTGDGGIDLKLIISEEETFLIQVKRRGDIHKNEGVKVVRELNGVLFREGKSKGMVITTARDFTKAARKETDIKTETEHKYAVKLVAFDDIIKMLRLPQVKPYKPWREHIDESELDGYSFLSDEF